MPNHARVAVWTAICAALAVTPGFAGPSAGLSNLSNGMAGVHRSIGYGDYAGAASAFGSLYDAGGGQFAKGAAPVAVGDEAGKGGHSSGILPAELYRAARSAWSGEVPAPDRKKAEEAASKRSETVAGLDVWGAGSVIYQATRDAVDTMDKAAKNVDAEGERRAREGAEKQREAEKKWEGKERNYPQYEKKK